MADLLFLIGIIVNPLPPQTKLQFCPAPALLTSCSSRAGNVVSVLLYGCPIATFWRIAKMGSTEEFDPLPYVATLLGASMWAYYGMLKPGGLLVATVNGAGAVFEALYVSLYMFFAPPPLKLKAGVLVAALDIGVLGFLVGVTFLALEEEMRLLVIGVICACLSLLMYGAPLAVMKIVVTTKSVEFMPFFLSLFLTLNGGIWTIYAMLDRDFFLGIANGIGFMLGSIQLVLYKVYMNPKAPKHLNAAAEEEWQHQRLIIHRVNTDEEEGPSII